MSDDSKKPVDKQAGDVSVTEAGARPAVLTRTAVTPGLPYADYRQQLRDDFYSCAYCTMSEVEALAVRFTIDHYEPKSARPDLENEYQNLMYCCDQCNLLKGDRYPNADARAAGQRFFRPDEDLYDAHFELTGLLLNGKTPTGLFSIHAIGLNRLALRRVRKLRRQLQQCNDQILAGIAALRKFPIDRLPSHLKGQAISAIEKIAKYRDDTMEEIDSVLKAAARSDLIDPESRKRPRESAKYLKSIEALYEGKWHGRK